MLETEPLSALITTLYGPAGAGKTLDAMRAFPNAVMIGRPHAFQPAQLRLGFTPSRVYPATSLEQARAHLLALAAKPPPDAYGAIVDDISLMSRETGRSAAMVQMRKDDSFGYFQTMQNKVVDLFGACETLLNATGWQVVCTAHARPADDKHPKAGVLFMEASWKTTPYWERMVSSVYYTTPAPKEWPLEWRYGYTADPSHPKIGGKDRLGLVGKFNVQNLGEYFRFAGYDVPRCWGDDWIEEWVEAGAGWLASGTPLGTVGETFFRDTKDAPHAKINWALYDAFSRYKIRASFAERVQLI